MGPLASVNLMKIRGKKPTVQVGDPFTEKLLLEACLELMKMTQCYNSRHEAG